MITKKYFFSLFFLLTFVLFCKSSAADNEQPNYIYMPIPDALKNEIINNAAPLPPSAIDYSFSNPDFTIQNAHQIIARVLPQNAQEVADPAQFYPLVAPCYANKLDRVYYHFMPASTPRMTYLWFDDKNGVCHFASYYLGTLEKTSIPSRARAQHCPVNSLRMQYLFTPFNLNLISQFEKNDVRTPATGEFIFRTEVCLQHRRLTTEQLQAMFPQ